MLSTRKFNAEFHDGDFVELHVFVCSLSFANFLPSLEVLQIKIWHVGHGSSPSLSLGELRFEASLTLI